MSTVREQHFTKISICLFTLMTHSIHTAGLSLANIWALHCWSWHD